MWDYRKVMLFKFSAYGFLKNLRFFEPFLYLFFLANGLSFFQIGILISIRGISVFLLEIPTGIIADVTGRRRAMASAFAFYIFSFIIFYTFSDFYIFIPGMLLFAVGETFRSGTHKSMIMEHLDNEDMSDKKVEYYGKTRSASKFGSALSALLAAALVFYVQDYNSVFLFTLVPYSFAFVLMLTYPPELDGSANRSSLSEMWKHTKESFRELYESPSLGKMMVNASIYDSFFKVSKDYLSPIVQKYALTVAFLLPLLGITGTHEQKTAILVGVVYFFVYMNSFVSSRKASSLMEKVGNMSRTLNILFFMLASAFLGVALFLHIGMIFLSIIAFFFFFALYNLRKPMVVGYLGDRITPDRRATLLSGHKQIRSIIGFIIAPILGYLADTFGLSYTFGFGAAVLFTVGILLAIRDEE